MSRTSICLVLLAVACAPAPVLVPVQATTDDRLQLAGRWEGAYSSEVTGRSGSIVFTLAAGRDTATGDVLMVPANSRTPLQPAEGVRPRPWQNNEAPSMLTIRFVQLQGTAIRGELAPYRAPDCDCVIETVFTGAVRGDRIIGTFTSYGEGLAAPATGRWEVRRKR